MKKTREQELQKIHNDDLLTFTNGWKKPYELSEEQVKNRLNLYTERWRTSDGSQKKLNVKSLISNSRFQLQGNMIKEFKAEKSRCDAMLKGIKKDYSGPNEFRNDNADIKLFEEWNKVIRKVQIALNDVELFESINFK